MADIRQTASDEDDLDIIRFSSEAEPRKETRIPLFYIDDVAYTVPKKPNPAIALKYLEKAHEEGSDEATYYLLTTMLGEEGYRALLDYAEQGKLSDEDYDTVVLRALDIVSRRQAIPKARQNGGRGRRN
jgi:hypothetical protein